MGALKEHRMLLGMSPELICFLFSFVVYIVRVILTCQTKINHEEKVPFSLVENGAFFCLAG